VAIAIVVATNTGRSAADEQRIKLLPSSQSGWRVDKSTHVNTCAAYGKDLCQSGRITSNAGGFRYLSSVAVDGAGDVYVADNGNSRIQILTPTGAFLAMFGWDANAPKDHQASATQAEKNVCTAASGDRCTAGKQGTMPGQFAYPASVSVDPISGNVYVAEISLGHMRIDKYTGDGRFVWMIGRGVNKTTSGNICTQKEILESAVKCGAGGESSAGSAVKAGFKMMEFRGNVIAAGGPEDLLYVGDEGRVQEFDADGGWRREFAVTSPSPVLISAIDVDARGYVYVVYQTDLVANVIRKFSPSGEALADFVVKTRPGATVTIHGLAIDLSGRLAVIGGEEGLVGGDEGVYDETYLLVGALYDSTGGHRLSEFTVPIGNDGLAFGDQDQLYIAATDGEEVLFYTPAPAQGLVTGPLLCGGGGEDETSAIFDCGAYR
jgi:hypothetical protein